MFETQAEVNQLCANISRALSVIYSNRMNADITITCVPVQIGGVNDAQNRVRSVMGKDRKSLVS